MIDLKLTNAAILSVVKEKIAQCTRIDRCDFYSFDS